METLDLGARGFVTEARQLINQRRSFLVRVTGWRARGLMRGLENRPQGEGRRQALLTRDLPFWAGTVGMAPLFALAVLAKAQGWHFRSEQDPAHAEVVIEFRAP